MDDRLRSALAELRTEIDRVQAGEKDLSSLDDLLHRVERKLDPEDEHDEDGLGDRLDDVITEYQVEHPRVTELLARLVDTLSAAGL